MNLELAILQSLSRLPDDLMMPVGALWNEVRHSAFPQPDRPTFDLALRRLEDDKRQIVRVTNADADKVKITLTGKARVAESLA